MQESVIEQDTQTAEMAAKLTVEEMAARIRAGIDETFAALIERRDAALAAEISPLEGERARLETESTELLSQRDELLRRLDAVRQVCQYESARLLLDGKDVEAQGKRSEMKVAEHAPAELDERHRQISARIAAIDGEKKAIAKRSFETWYSELKQFIRAAEHGLFLSLLDKARNEMETYEQRHALGATLSEPYGFIRDHHVIGLTSPGNSPEWNSAIRWYRSRGSTR